MTFILSRLQSATKTKLKQTNKTQDKYFTTLRWLINTYVSLCPNFFLDEENFQFRLILSFFSLIMMPLRRRKIYIIQVNSKHNKSETERIPQLITKKN